MENNMTTGTIDNLPSGCFYIIVYPRGDKTKISIAEAQYFDVPDYSLASRKWFLDEEECHNYAKKLAQINKLKFESDYRKDFLD
jgi:hypothetical protein